jgi:hypothetical protein
MPPRRPVVDHARAHEQDPRAEARGRSSSVERPDDVVLERVVRVVDRVLHRDRCGEVRDRVDAASQRRQAAASRCRPLERRTRDARELVE